MSEKLSGIERELVLQYLIDGNVPVTISPVVKDESSDNPISSNFFPVAIKDKLTVKDNNLIVIENPPENVLKFENKMVKVEFYFNRVGLYFTSILKIEKSAIELTIPLEISRIKDIVEEKNYDFSASVYYQFQTASNINLKCVPWEKANLFTKPVWKEIPLENQKKAKNYLEQFVNEAKVEKNIGYGIQLLPICNYLTSTEEFKMEAMQNRFKDLQILYVDQERIIFGFEYTAYQFVTNDEYGLKLEFSIKKGPISTRDIFATAIVNKIYKSEDEKRFCVDFKYTTIQEEDLRFLYEKSTKNLFI